jgi:hypothetical protein
MEFFPEDQTQYLVVGKIVTNLKTTLISLQLDKY